MKKFTGRTPSENFKLETFKMEVFVTSTNFQSVKNFKPREFPDGLESFPKRLEDMTAVMLMEFPVSVEYGKSEI